MSKSMSHFIKDKHDYLKIIILFMILWTTSNAVIIVEALGPYYFHLVVLIANLKLNLL
jgi:hypothetical protein